MGLLPFAAAIGVVYWTLMRDHDINFYLSQRPPSFWAAVSIAAVIVALLVVLLVRTIARWALALPLVLFEGVVPRRALGESATRLAGHRSTAIAALAVWAVLAAALAGRRRVGAGFHRPRPGARIQRLDGDAAGVHHGARAAVGRARPRGGRGERLDALARPAPAVPARRRTS